VKSNADRYRILKEIGKGERIALSKLAVEHLERTGRPFRIAIDVAIWQFQNQAGQGGANPALRTLYYRLLKLLALPVHPIFVYDGKNKPLTKRNKTVTAYGTCLPNEMSKNLIQAFRFPYHTAPGEAEAECALLQRKGIVDAVMSQDVDTLMFGSTMTLRDWSKEGTRNNKTASHVTVLRAEDTLMKTGLDSDGMILVALLSGGDYNTEGVAGFGPSLACEIAKAQFGAELLQLLRQGNTKGVKEWRDRLQYELETNESGYFKKRHKTVKIPDDFPDSTILSYYTEPAVSSPEQLQKIRSTCAETWDTDIDIPALRVYVAEKFEWLYKTGAKKLIRTLAPSLLANRLRRGLTSTAITSPDCIQERRIHFINDGLPELRVEVIPNDIVPLNIEDEEENPAVTEDAPRQYTGPVLDTDDMNNQELGEAEDHDAPPTPSKRRGNPPWDPGAPQKIWVPETIAKLGIAAFVEAWEQKQRDILVDPKKFATRKCPKSKPKVKVKDPGMKTGALDGYFTLSKPGAPRNPHPVGGSKPKALSDLPDCAPVTGSTAPMMPSKKSSTSYVGHASPTIDRYFNRPPFPQITGLDRRKDRTAAIQLPPRARYPALGLYGSEARSSDTEGQLAPKRMRSGKKDSNSTPARSPEIHEKLPQTAPALIKPGEHLGNGDRKATGFSESIVISSSPPLPTVTAISLSTASPPSQQFPQSAAQRNKQRPRKPLSPITAQACTAPTTTTMKDRFPTKKPIVLSRESLPGTWKEVEDEKLVIFSATAQQRQLARVSILDMTDV
jgi:holliday junction resolvase YEN1